MRIDRRIVITLLILVNLAGLGWWQRKPLLAWWEVRALMHADEASRDACVDRVVALDDAAVPRLLDGLSSTEEKICSNLEAALVAMAAKWKTLDPRSAPLLEELHNRFAGFSDRGQASALRVAASLLNQSADEEALPVRIAQAAGDLLNAARIGGAHRAPVLWLANALVARVAPGQWLDPCRQLARTGLAVDDPKVRVAALHLTMHEALRTEQDLLSKALPLLHDPKAEVRRAAVLALGSMPELVSEDELLPLLHDPDAEVQQLCELALRGRGLQDRHLELARLISDESPTARLQVLQHLRGGNDVEPMVWLRRLSHDTSPAVRAAAVRAAAGQPQIDLRDRLAEMMQRDASPTVRELAAHYLMRNTQ